MGRASFAARPRWSRRSLYQHEFFYHDRCLIQFTIGSIPHVQVMRSIELFGTQVAPALRDALGS